MPVDIDPDFSFHHETPGPSASPGLSTAGVEDPDFPAAESDLNALVQILYGDLHRIARGVMFGQPNSHTLQATALINEAYMRLLRSGENRWKDRKHFLLSVAKVMRTVLIDHYRSKHAIKRSAAQRVDVDLDRIVASMENEGIDLERMETALDRLAVENPEWSRIVHLRVYCGVPMAEIGELLKSPNARWIAAGKPSGAGCVGRWMGRRGAPEDITKSREADD
ncbi:MAG: ECF-type sigma factor [Planctomycetota bacterium]